MQKILIFSILLFINIIMVSSNCDNCDYYSQNGYNVVDNCLANTTNPNCVRLNCEIGCAVYSKSGQCLSYYCPENNNDITLAIMFGVLFGIACIVLMFCFIWYECIKPRLKRDFEPLL